MRNKITYEWVAEPIDKHGDIIDPLFSDTFAGAVKQAEGFKCAAVYYALVCNIGEDINGLQDRDYAYIGSDGLPEYFPELGRRVPQRYHEEVKAAGGGM